jgi:cytochrome c oxidase subunit 3
MANKQAHPYHLVDPSPWPFLASMSLLALTLGMAMSMHGVAFGNAVLAIGVLSILYVAYSWWRDVLVESKKDPVHTNAVQIGLRAGMALFIISEVMFFAAFFWAFFNASIYPITPLEDVWAMAEGFWPPEGVETFNAWDLPLLNTLILLLSGTTVTWAHHALLHNDRKGLIQGLTYSVALGFIFTALQAYEYSHAAFGFKDGIYASTFYMATGFHGVHVLIGTLFLLVCLLRARKGGFSVDHHLGFEFAAWYWHFVDVVWLFLFVFVYWWGG